jgi:biotin--protein ligase
MAALGVASFSAQVESFQDTSDTFQFHPFEDGLQLLEGVRNGSLSPSTQTIKHVIVCTDGKLPALNHTPLFDLALFYETLSVARSNCGLRNAVDQWGMGEVLLYGEIVTSTQTMLDK